MPEDCLGQSAERRAHSVRRQESEVRGRTTEDRRQNFEFRIWNCELRVDEGRRAEGARYKAQGSKDFFSCAVSLEPRAFLETGY